MNVREISQVFQDGFPNELIAWEDLLLKMRDSTFKICTTKKEGIEHHCHPTPFIESIFGRGT